ncbi:hypothetical protein LGV61_03215 [Desulfurispirillum indicum]|uniref:hypothetical protein n=1 Tax=Desulfurispirillum indicum TaxID=936456 RepID=UPI001CFB8137|nr:hypothetical protein [Desulfurispirillum indicum]UCZ57303.1 hypothetical protein LGV61_03215 [Desulfurispirillum indicum]
MKALLRISTLVLTLLAGAPLSLSDENAPSPFDAARILMESQGQLDGETIGRIFDAGVTANMQIPPRYIGVAFYDTRTGGQLDATEIRELMGALRQDGARELLMMAQSFTGNLPMEAQTLSDLLDAAFIASMRNPPQHISIEFYDTRVGSSGQGGGVSGRTPEQVHREPAPITEDESSIAPQEAWLEADELMALARELQLAITPKEESILVPVLLWGRTDAELHENLQELLKEMAEADLFMAHPDAPYSDVRKLERQDDLQVYFGLMYITGDQEILRLLQEVFPDINPAAQSSRQAARDQIQQR